jgi:tetratricopeptide (TPR) repeat protein
MGEPRSHKQQREQLVRSLRTSGASWVETASALQQHFRVNARVAFRYAHGWSQRRAADEWNKRWPDELKTFKAFSYWELWPSSTGHAPSFDNFGKLAELYECAVSDLLVDLPDFRHLDTAASSDVGIAPDKILASVDSCRHRYAEIDDMNRRELLRLLAIAGVALAAPHIADQVDWDRVDHAARTARLDAATADEYAKLNAQLWHIFAASQTKSVTFPLVRSQLGVLTNGLQQARGSGVRQRLSSLVADLFQLAGEISFDANHYTDAAHCYTLAATASKEAEAFDLWACSMTRHAFIGVYERQFDKALPMLILAADLARNGDSSLSTRHWVSTVQAHTFAGLGDLDACQKSLDDAEHVHHLTGQVHNSGWLRFEGSRLAEERGTCYVELRRPDLAETALNDALRQNLSARRRGSVLTDLAMTGVQRRDPDRIVTYATTALDTARHTGSGVIGRKLQGLQTHLSPFLDNSRVRYLNIQIANLTGASTV